MKPTSITKVGVFLATISLLTIPLQSSASYNVVLSEENTGIYSYTLNPGESKTDKITVENLEETPLTLLIYPGDSTKSSQGSFALTDISDEQRTIGKWIKLENETVEIPGKEKAVIPFTLTVPNTITPGTYSGGLATESVTSKGVSATGAPVLATKARLVNKLFVKVPGEKKHNPVWEDFVYNKLGGNNHSFTLKFKNDGNTYVIGESKVEIFGFPNAQPSDFEITDDMPQELKDQKISNKYDNTIKFNNVDIVRDTENQIIGYWKLKPLFGSYTAKATVVFYEYDVATGKKINPQTLTKEINFIVVDFNIILLILLFVAFVGSWIGGHKIYRHNQRKNSDSYTVKEGETLMNIAKSNNISWKTLAKINKLKAPYEVTPDQKILVPKSKKTK